MRKRILALFIVFCCCPWTTFGASFQDALQREVVLPAPPQKIISLVPSVTEILFALGLQEQIIATTDACTFPEAAQHLPKVGSYSEPSLEAILLHRPDLVFASADQNRPTLVQQLERLGIPVYVVYPRNVLETLATIRQIGTVAGVAEAGERLASSIEARIAAVRKSVSTASPPLTLECVMLQPLTVAGPETFVDDLIRLAGGRNAVPPGPSRYPTWNSEALLSADPEMIVVSAYPGQPDPTRFFDRWPQLRAVRDERIIRIEADWIHRPGPRMILAIEALARALHPESPNDD